MKSDFFNKSLIDGCIGIIILFIDLVLLHFSFMKRFRLTLKKSQSMVSEILSLTHQRMTSWVLKSTKVHFFNVMYI